MEPSGNVVEQQVVSLEDEIEAEERRALAEQAEADRLSAIAAELAAQSRTRLTTVALARATLNGEQLPVLLRDDEPGCRESFPDWI